MPYVEMGWALIPLHDVSSGSCSCGKDCGKSAGKHPRNVSWQRGGWIRNGASLSHLVNDRPYWNFGAVTGAPSGIWVLDVDPDNGGMESLGELLEAARLKLDFPAMLSVGALVVRAHRTGSGGVHLIFAIGPDGWMPRTGAGRIGPGLDVRAEGGQIVLPSSVSGVGPYSVAADVAPTVVPSALRAEIERRLTPVPRQAPAVARAEVQPGAVVERGEAYARSVVMSECAELTDAPIGVRNDAAYRTACRVWEIVNAPWNSWDEARVWALWYPAAVVTGAPDDEVYGVWDRARDRVGGSVALLPESTLGGDRVPFVGSPAPGSPDASPFREAGLPPRRADASPDDPVSAFLGAMLSPEQLEARPAPRPLVGGLLFLDTCAWLIGKSGSLKSFVALDLAGHVGRGEEWQGTRVERGEAWYVVGEGLGGMKLRVAAWQRRYGEMKDVRFIPLPVQADERRSPGMWTVMVEAARRCRPRLIVLDTQARATVGLDENSNGDMSYFAQQADRLRQASGGCVLVVHHMGAASTGRARGATAIDGAQDTELRVVRTGPDSIELWSDKQKDARELGMVTLTVEASDGGVDPETGMDLGSLVLTPGRAVAEVIGATSAPASTPIDQDAPFTEARIRPMSENDKRTLAMYRLILVEFNDGLGATQARIEQRFFDLPEIKFLRDDARRKARDRAWTTLGKLGLLMRAYRSQRYKVVVLPHQAEAGALTKHHKSDDWMPPDGWDVQWPDGNSE